MNAAEYETMIAAREGEAYGEDAERSRKAKRSSLRMMAQTAHTYFHDFVDPDLPPLKRIGHLVGSYMGPDRMASAAALERILLEYGSFEAFAEAHPDLMEQAANDAERVREDFEERERAHSEAMKRFRAERIEELRARGATVLVDGHPVPPPTAPHKRTPNPEAISRARRPR